ncbi:MAG: ParB/RepB/Spo0J family partition protein [Oscillospiraceae bacterium]|jgi:ParB family chromosome partitioning protein|nr:ParB/RepB/Spo0J family partition protein [Oscillospiraceae bacterium]
MAEKTHNKRGLGTGLGALFGEDSIENDLSGAMSLAIEKVEPKSDQPRNSFDRESLQALSDSIRQYGMIQPITVRRLDSGYYQIVAGERRWRAARLAGLSEVPVRVIEADDKKAMELALVENLQREDLNAIEEAKGYRTLIEEYGMTQEEASQSIGKSRSAITNALRLLKLAPPVMAMVEDGDISAGHARALLAIRDEADQLRAATKVISESLSVRQAESLAAKLSAPATERDTPNDDSTVIRVNYLAEAEKRLKAALGRKVTIRDGSKKGLVELEYYGSDDREVLIDALLKFGGAKGDTGCEGD